MQTLSAIVLVLLLVGLSNSQFSGDGPTFGGDQTPVVGETYNVGYPECSRYESNGSLTTVLYDQCTSYCCGGYVINNSTASECCGSELYGRPYNPRYEQCCEWWTGHGKGHIKPWFGRGRYDCCGAEKIRWGAQSCCYGHPDPPEVFDHTREICCNSHRVRVPSDVKYAECCGDFAAYDKRLQSCPCGEGTVLKVPRSQSACCETVDGFKSPYNTKTHFCCNGMVGEQMVDFCCGSSGLGKYGSQVCCTDKVFPVNPPNANLTACCNGKAYNPNFDICCNDVITEIIEGADKCCAGFPYSEDKSICCQGNLLNRDTEGTQCCATFAFFSDKGSFCCNDQVFQSENVGGDSCCGSGATIDFYYKDDSGLICCEGVLRLQSQGDSCCGSDAYFAANAICCDRQISERVLGDTCCRGQPYFPESLNAGNKLKSICCGNGPFGPFKNPKCCGGEGHDIEGGTICCGDRVYGKYSYPSCCVDVGYDAKTHSCCGSTVLPHPPGSLRAVCCSSVPIDEDTQMCCSGTNLTIPEGVPISKARCCDVTGVYHEDNQLCCLGKIFDKTSRWTSKCCGDVMYDSNEQICCDANDGFEPALNDFEYGKDNSKCCGILLYNASSEYCCEGVLSPKTSEETECCAGIPFDRTKNICCHDQLQDIGSRVPWRRAECCGGKCYFRGPQRCCNNRIYARNKLSDLTCEDYK